MCIKADTVFSSKCFVWYICEIIHSDYASPKRGSKAVTNCKMHVAPLYHYITLLLDNQRLNTDDDHRRLFKV